MGGSGSYDHPCFTEREAETQTVRDVSRYLNPVGLPQCELPSPVTLCFFCLEGADGLMGMTPVAQGSNPSSAIY